LVKKGSVPKEQVSIFFSIQNLLQGKVRELKNACQLVFVQKLKLRIELFILINILLSRFVKNGQNINSLLYMKYTIEITVLKQNTNKSISSVK
jgi:hypothetical protein